MKFCTNCGNKLEDNMNYCINCGTIVNKQNMASKTKTPGKGLGIAGMVLGICAVFYSVCTLFIFFCLLVSGEYFLGFEKIAIGFVFLFLPVALPSIGLPLSFASRNKTKTGINLTGLILNTVAIFLCITSIFILIVL